MKELNALMLPMAGFAFAMSASPGPVNMVSAMSGARFGALRSFPYVLGATVGFVGILAAVGAGLGVSVARYPNLVRLMALLGAAYMLSMAWRIARASMQSGTPAHDLAAPPTGWSGAVAQLINPKAWIVSVSAVSIFVATHTDYVAALSLCCAIFFVICLLSLWSWSLMGALVARWAGGVRVFNLVMAALLALSIVYFLLDLLRTG
ncbi:LysE family translocator [Hylemonella sp. W303a]|uniref:LysE family translocator n=1 Tax=Hylemonella sp. W303a TaxID=3389873 RepID=UPI00396B0418